VYLSPLVRPTVNNHFFRISSKPSHNYFCYVVADDGTVTSKLNEGVFLELYCARIDNVMSASYSEGQGLVRLGFSEALRPAVAHVFISRRCELHRL
jgi:hypothetical protein